MVGTLTHRRSTATVSACIWFELLPETLDKPAVVGINSSRHRWLWLRLRVYVLFPEWIYCKYKCTQNEK
jgi:hypothetical protein